MLGGMPLNTVFWGKFLLLPRLYRAKTGRQFVRLCRLFLGVDDGLTMAGSGDVQSDWNRNFSPKLLRARNDS
jgi:hypothetical protein